MRREAERTRSLIDARLEALALAALTQQRLDDTLQGSQVIVFTQDTGLRYTWIRNPDPAFHPEAIIGRTDEELCTPDDAATLTAIKQAVLRTGEAARSRVTLANGDESATYDLYVKPLLDREGTVSGLSCVSTNVTALTEVQKELERANQAKDEFLSFVSHELKAPLTLIRGNASLLPRLRSAGAAATFDESIAEIVNASERLERIIDDLLLLARLSQGVEIEKEPLLLPRLVDEMVREHLREFPDRDVKVSTVGDPRPVPGQPVYMAQVIKNLLSNAAKYAPPDQPIEITVAGREEDVTLSVRDHGNGIPESERMKIFESFYRSKASPPAPGLGIGLRVCLLLTEAQGGTISVQNHVDGGAEFMVRLPAHAYEGFDD